MKEGLVFSYFFTGAFFSEFHRLLWCAPTPLIVVRSEIVGEHVILCGKRALDSKSFNWFISQPLITIYYCFDLYECFNWNYLFLEQLSFVHLRN